MMPHSHAKHPAVTLSVRVPPHMRDQLDALAEVTGRTKSFLAAEAIQSYLSSQTWQVTAIKKAIKKADEAPNLFEHGDVTDWLNSWGTKNELEPPK